MRDITDPRLMYLKARLFLGIGMIAGGLILVEMPTVRVAALLGATVWAFCRLYYFCFYVIGKYIDPQFRFAGLWSVVKYLMTRRGREHGADDQPPSPCH
jgi:hypothetical protein